MDLLKRAELVLEHIARIADEGGIHPTELLAATTTRALIVDETDPYHIDGVEYANLCNAMMAIHHEQTKKELH